MVMQGESVCSINLRTLHGTPNNLEDYTVSTGNGGLRDFRADIETMRIPNLL